MHTYDVQATFTLNSHPNADVPVTVSVIMNMEIDSDSSVEAAEAGCDKLRDLVYRHSLHGHITDVSSRLRR